MLEYRIHGGRREIGGNCIELIEGSQRIVLDMGIPLAAENPDEVPLPDIPGLPEPDESLLGVLVSHAHLDHYGLLSRVGDHVPVYMGEATARIIEEAAFFTRMPLPKNIKPCLSCGVELELGPFRVRPYLVDHSAYESFAFLVDTKDDRLFYTGDIRAHGYKASLMEQLLRNPPAGVNKLIIEGTRVPPNGEEDTHGNMSEADVVDALMDVFKRTEGLAMVVCSGQNIDRIVSVTKAANRSNRAILLDLYASTMLQATGNPKVPQHYRENTSVFIPRSQRVAVLESAEFWRTEELDADRIYLKDIRRDPSRWVAMVRVSTVPELLKAGCLEGSSAVWSMWPGYLEDSDSGRRFSKLCAENGIPIEVVHSSGHAPAEFLKRFERAINPKEVIRIHSLA